MRAMASGSVSVVITDPPYGLSDHDPADVAECLAAWLRGEEYHPRAKGGFMGRSWDAWVPGPEVWREAYRVMKPGAHLLAFSGSRTLDLMSMAIRLAGFEIRDTLQWLYGTGFPKSLNVSKAIDKMGGASIAWFGPWFRAWRASKGISQKEVAALFPSKTGGLTGCVANWELGLNMPTIEQFNTIRDAFSLPFESLKDVERAVVGHYKVPRMVIFQGWKEPYDQPRTTYPKGRGYRAGGHYYTCKHHDSATGNCRDYQNRPRMCSDFPYGRACPYDDCQAPEHGRFEHLFAPGRIPPVAVVERVYGHRALPVIVDANKAP